MRLTAAEQAWLDQEDRFTTDTIRRYGVFLEYVMGGGRGRPSFCYTIGLFGMGHPELLVFGLHQDSAAELLNTLAERVRAGHDLTAGEVVEVGDRGLRVTVAEVPNPGAIVFGANRFYQRPSEASVPVLQLTYPDDSGRFPEDEGYDLPAWLQPRPGEFAA